RAGVKPFFYSYQPNELFLFGSELKALMAHPEFKKEIDEAAVASFLQYGTVSGSYSIFKGTQKLLPGHLMRLNFEKSELSIQKYWDVYDYYNQPKLNISLP